MYMFAPLFLLLVHMHKAYRAAMARFKKMTDHVLAALEILKNFVVFGSMNMRAYLLCFSAYSSLSLTY